MKRILASFFLLSLIITSVSGQTQKSGTDELLYKNVAPNIGFEKNILGMVIHGAAWGDINGDNYPDLFLGVFANHCDFPNLILLNHKGKRFTIKKNPAVEVESRNSGASFADFDGDGDDDLVTVHINDVAGFKEKPKYAQSNFLYRNDGKGNFTDVTANSNLSVPGPWFGRNPFVIDYDGDGMLDLLMQDDDVWQRSIGKSKLMKNKGNMVFEDVTIMAGLGTHLNGLGGAVADINGDSWPDFFFAQTCVMFINKKDGTFGKVDYDFIPAEYTKTFQEGNSEWTCGADLGDLDNDGDLDLVMGVHFKDLPQKISVYLNEGNDADGFPKYKNITNDLDLITTEKRQPYVEIQDYDGDGFPDILVGNPEVFMYRNLGIKDGPPQFEHIKVPDGISAGWLGYWVACPSVDFDMDGKLDLFYGSYDSLVTCPLVRNISPERNWLKVRISLPEGGNRKGIGAMVSIYKKGMSGKADGFLGMQYITVSRGYSSGCIPEANFGIPGEDSVDVVVQMPCDGEVYRFEAKKNTICLMPGGRSLKNL